MKQTQLIKGTLEGCVLGIISQKEVYGYELMQALKENGFESIVGGTLYPLLAKLEKNGDLVSTIRASDNGPDRKYYSLTTQGQQTLSVFEKEWNRLNGNVNQILRQAKNHE